MSLINHIETFLGTIDEGWKLTESPSGIKVVRFRNKPCADAVTYVTVGLSNQVLPMSKGRDVREELVFSTYEKFPSGPIASFLLTFGDYLLSQHQALLRGDVVGPSDPIVPNVYLNAIYAAMPVMFEPEFATYAGTDPPTVLVWLVPLHGIEAAFVKSNGWSRFEDLLEIKDSDLLDLNRPPLC